MEEIILKPIDDNNFYDIVYPIIDSDLAKLIVGKHIHFTWVQNGNESILPGMVLSYDNNKLKIYTVDILNDNEDYQHLEDVEMFIKEISINELKNVTPFEKWNKTFWELSKNIIFDEEEIPVKTKYKVKTIYGKTFECVLFPSDSFSANIQYLNNNNEVCSIDYPLYFIEELTPINN